MLKRFFKQLEKRLPIDTILSRHEKLFEKIRSTEVQFSEEAFSSLLSFLEKGEPSYQSVAVQAAVRWSGVSQRVLLRNTVLRRGIITPSCLWAFKQLRGSVEELYRDYSSPEMAFMQIILLKESDPALSIPFLIERFLTKKETPEEIRFASRLCVLRLLDSGVSPELVSDLQKKYPAMEILKQWRPTIPGKSVDFAGDHNITPVDFHQLIRTVHDMKEFSSLTRTLYLVSLLYIPLTEKEWRSLLLSRTDSLFFRKLQAARMIEQSCGGFVLSTESSKQSMVRKFLFDSYSLAKESVHKNHTQRLKEERKSKVRDSELDRQALEIVPDGIICVDRTGLLYYMNPAAEHMLNDCRTLRERLFGTGSLEEALKRYSREGVLSRISASMRDNGDETEIFGDRISIEARGKRFEVELGNHVILLRDVTDKHLIDKEIGKLYRHELKAALDVMGVGLDGAKQSIVEGQIEEGIKFLDQVENKRKELFAMLEERIDFIRLHSDSFHINPSPVNLNLVVDKCVLDYREAAANKTVTIRSDHLHVGSLQVLGEERFLVRALDNIVRNAVRFAPKGSDIRINLGADNFESYIRVEDQGPGISPENLGKIFQLGFTTGGTGRGLYLARRIVIAHGGRIEVKSKPGSGSCFTVKIPVAVQS